MTLRDFVCASAPEDCHRDQVLRLYSADQQTLYDAVLGEHHLRIPLGYVAPVQVISDELRGKKIFLNAAAPNMAPRGHENVSDFLHKAPNIARIEVALYRGAPWSEMVRTEIERRKRTFESVKKYPDVAGLQHWGNDYKAAPWAKPCERQGEMQQCGMREQDDLYVPLGGGDGGGTYIRCAAWPYMKTSTASQDLRMSTEQRDAAYAGRAGKPAGWRMAVEPHCSHNFYHASIGARVTLIYHLALLPDWQRIEQRTRGVLDTFTRRP
jgi:hypothetical protein